MDYFKLCDEKLLENYKFFSQLSQFFKLTNKKLRYCFLRCTDPIRHQIMLPSNN